MNTTIICSNLTTGTNNVVLIPNQTIKNLVNTGNYRLILACNIPDATSNFPVFIQVGTTNNYDRNIQDEAKNYECLAARADGCGRTGERGGVEESICLYGDV